MLFTIGLRLYFDREKTVYSNSSLTLTCEILSQTTLILTFNFFIDSVYIIELISKSLSQILNWSDRLVSGSGLPEWG